MSYSSWSDGGARRTSMPRASPRRSERRFFPNASRRRERDREMGEDASHDVVLGMMKRIGRARRAQSETAGRRSCQKFTRRCVGR
jgi:hypothetical protein